MTEWILQYWCEVGFGLVVLIGSAAGKKIFARLKKMKKEQQAQCKGIQALLRDRIVTAYYHYQDRKSITLHGLENINAMYAEYHNLGGNGTVTKLVNDLRELPVVDD